MRGGISRQTTLISCQSSFYRCAVYVAENLIYFLFSTSWPKSMKAQPENYVLIERALHILIIAA